jgi:hypothetical protein
MNWLRFVDLGIYLTLAAVTGMHWQNDRHHCSDFAYTSRFKPELLLTRCGTSEAVL